MERGNNVPRETCISILESGCDRLCCMQDQIDTLLQQFPAWKYESNTLVAEWRLQNFTALRTVITGMCDLADELNHHPTVTYGYNTLRVETTTHDAGNVVTQKDIELATRVSELVGE